MIHGIGTDVVSVARVERLLTTEGGGFLRWFTSAEIAYCQGKANPARHFAARLAAKESVAKALRLSQDRAVPWRAIEVVLDETGAPGVELHDTLAGEAPSDSRWHLTLSHSDEQATAVAVLESAAGAARSAIHPRDPGADRPVLPEHVVQSIQQYVRSRGTSAPADPQLEAVRTAIMLEDVADVVLADDQIDPDVLADEARATALVRNLRGGA